MKKQIQQKLLDSYYQKIRSCLMLAIFKWYGKLINTKSGNQHSLCLLHVNSVQILLQERYHNTWNLGVVLHKLCLKG